MRTASKPPKRMIPAKCSRTKPRTRWREVLTTVCLVYDVHLLP
ncbi:hypothetical protein PoMZ_03448 [Pyricularia oryzae]|uniref:Uncharacterized protein n=1 Tax=Pyricularia oryzae TaxID=318829 RepID=A0A4V1C634_PYROR|nr:hypothetical protein PoMZ_03448 [Pyricularia oryzae]